MNYSKYIPVILTIAAVGAGTTRVEAAQRRGPGSGVVGRAVPRGTVAPRIVGRPVVVSPRVAGFARYRPYYYPYRRGITVGFYSGFYPYGYYPYGYYPYGYYPYGYSYPFYGAYGYGAYGYPSAGYATPGAAYGRLRIEGAPRDSQVLADGYYVGIVDDFDGAFQHLSLSAGPHRIEIRPPGSSPIAFDVRIEPGQTVTYHANVP